MAALGGKIAKVGAKVSARLAAALGLTAGAGTFFGFEWLTNGGVADSASGALGIPEWTVNAVLITVILVVGYLLVTRIFGSTGATSARPVSKPRTAPRKR